MSTSEQKKEIRLGDIFSEEILEEALQYRHSHKDLLEKIIKPNMEMINRKTGQENDPAYWAYALEYALVEYKIEKNRNKIQ